MAEPLLDIQALAVAVGGRRILNGVSLTIHQGEVHVLMGPNGGGKTTLLMAIMGLPGYRVASGRILLAGEEITGLSADARARRGVALSFQKPPSIRGITVRGLLGRIPPAGGGAVDTEGLAAALRMEALLDRELNVGLSGGEVKRSELLQLLAMDPLLALFDEPESGVDLDSIAVVGAGMRRLLGRDHGERRKAALIVTHTGHILREVPADRGHVLLHGAIACRGDPAALFSDIRAHGYEG
jgi:Fe-S cluster assembly ATP-binding protein